MKSSSPTMNKKEYLGILLTWNQMTKRIAVTRKTQSNGSEYCGASAAFSIMLFLHTFRGEKPGTPPTKEVTTKPTNSQVQRTVVWLMR
jgi:hypothetical protein